MRGKASIAYRFRGWRSGQVPSPNVTGETKVVMLKIEMRHFQLVIDRIGIVRRDLVS